MANKIPSSQSFSCDKRKDLSTLRIKIMPGKLLQHCPLFAFVVLFLCSRMFAEEMATEKDEGLFDLSIEQLMEVEVD